MKRGGINSNITDMAKWLKFQVNSGVFEGKPLITIVMFEADKVKVTAQVGTHYNQGHGGYKLHTRPGRLRNSGVRESSIRGESSICQGSK